MKGIFSSGILAGCMAAGLWTVTPSYAAPGTWQDPTGGWEAVYDASSGLLPWQLSGTGTALTWNNQTPRTPGAPGFQTTDSTGANYADVITDDVSGESAMFMNHDDSVNPVVALQMPPGSGGESDLMTIDFRFRLFSDLPADTPDSSLPTTIPLMLSLVRPPTTAQLSANPNASEQFWQVRFRKLGLIVLGANSSGANVTQSANGVFLGNDWHVLRIHVNVATGAASFYLDGSSTAALSDIFPRVNSNIDPEDQENNFQFGGSGTNIAGAASVSYVKITSDELAAVIPEPAAAWLLGMGAAGLMWRRRSA